MFWMPDYTGIQKRVGEARADPAARAAKALGWRCNKSAIATRRDQSWWMPSSYFFAKQQPLATAELRLQKSYQKSWPWVISCCYSFLITLHLDYWNICLKYSRNSPAHLSTRGLECFGQEHLIFQEMDDIIPLSVSCAALPITPSFTALCWFIPSSTHLTPTWADARS